MADALRKVRVPAELQDPDAPCYKVFDAFMFCMSALGPLDSAHPASLVDSTLMPAPFSSNKSAIGLLSHGLPRLVPDVLHHVGRLHALKVGAARGRCNPTS